MTTYSNYTVNFKYFLIIKIIEYSYFAVKKLKKKNKEKSKKYILVKDNS